MVEPKLRFAFACRRNYSKIIIFTLVINQVFYKPEDIINQIKTSTAHMRLLKNGIVHYTYLPKAKIDVEQQLENHYALIELLGDKKHPLLLDASELVDISPDARLKVKELEPISPILARAFVTQSLGHKLMISFYLKFNKPYVQNKVFSNYEDAVEWLLQLQ